MPVLHMDDQGQSGGDTNKASASNETKTSVKCFQVKVEKKQQHKNRRRKKKKKGLRYNR